MAGGVVELWGSVHFGPFVIVGLRVRMGSFPELVLFSERVLLPLFWRSSCHDLFLPGGHFGIHPVTPFQTADDPQAHHAVVARFRRALWGRLRDSVISDRHPKQLCLSHAADEYPVVVGRTGRMLQAEFTGRDVVVRDRCKSTQSGTGL